MFYYCEINCPIYLGVITVINNIKYHHRNILDFIILIDLSKLSNSNKDELLRLIFKGTLKEVMGPKKNMFRTDQLYANSWTFFNSLEFLEKKTTSNVPLPWYLTNHRILFWLLMSSLARLPPCTSPGRQNQILVPSFQMSQLPCLCIFFIY